MTQQNPNLAPHPLADLVPAMSPDEYLELVESIRDQGLHEPIWRYEGKILDGRHRYRACGETSTEPRFREYTGTSPAAFVLAANAHRRQLDPGQRAMLAVAFLPELEREAKARQAQAGKEHGRGMDRSPRQRAKLSEPKNSAAEAAAKTGASPRGVQAAKRVSKADPELAEQVRRGEVKLKTAERRVATQEQARRIAQAEGISEEAASALKVRRAKALKVAAEAISSTSELVILRDDYIEAVLAVDVEDYLARIAGVIESWQHIERHLREAAAPGLRRIK